MTVSAANIAGGSCPWAIAQPGGGYKISGRRFLGPLMRIQVPNVTIEGCEYVGDHDDLALVIFESTGGVLRYSSVHSTDPANRLQYCVQVNGNGTVIEYCDLKWSPDHIQAAGGVSGVRIRENYIHATTYGTAGRSDHNDCCQFFGGGASDLQVVHNTMILDLDPPGTPLAQTSCLAFFQDATSGSNAYDNLLVQNNLFAGGGSSLYCGAETGKSNSGWPVTNAHYLDNHFSTQIWPNGGNGSPARDYPTAGAGNAWSGNAWHDGPLAGQTIPAP